MYEASKLELLPVAGVAFRVVSFENTYIRYCQVKKKKAFEDLAQHLRTDDNKIATYQGTPITTSGGACTADTVAGGVLS